MEISVRQTNLKPSSIRALMANGIVLVSHLNSFDEARLAMKTRLPIDECDKILASTKPKRPHFVIKAPDLMVRDPQRITTVIKELDAILGGGIKCGHITEISGEAGAGKSNLCCGIAAMVMLPQDKGGLDSEVMFIHTEGKGKLTLALRRLGTLVQSISDTAEQFIQSRLHVRNCFDELELIEMVNRLPEILIQAPNVRLIIIDSITCAFIQPDSEPDIDYYGRRDIKLTKLVKVLFELAIQQQVAVVVTNHVAYNPKYGQNIPALGKVWSHMCQTKIYIERADIRDRTIRFAHVSKGALKSPEPIRFEISNNLLD